MTQIQEETREIISKVIAQAKLKKGDALVIGCSSSEVNGDVMGTNSSTKTAEKIFDVIYELTNIHGIFLAAQCCEHLNRAVVVESDYAEKHGLDTVNVQPMPKAGGSFATCAYERFKNPVVVETLKANAGVDIGGVLIGMHIKAVAVPIKLGRAKIGEAIVVAARSRPKFIGGERAHYQENML